MKITPRFYKREARNMVEGEVIFRILSSDPNRVRMFVRELDDSPQPSRICVEMTKAEVIALFAHMQIEIPYLEA